MRATFDYSPALRSELGIMRHRCAVVCPIPDSDLQVRFVNWTEETGAFGKRPFC